MENPATSDGPKSTPGSDSVGDAFTIDCSATPGIIVIRAWGFWSLDHAGAYLDTLRKTIARHRAARRPLSILLDLSQSPVQSADVAAAIRTANQNLYQAGDRRAIVVSSNLLRMQLKRSYAQEETEVFSDEAAALRWLQRS